MNDIGNPNHKTSRSSKRRTIVLKPKKDRISNTTKVYDMNGIGSLNWLLGTIENIPLERLKEKLIMVTEDYMTNNPDVDEKLKYLLDSKRKDQRRNND